jgi:hypothetical protein
VLPVKHFITLEGFVLINLTLSIPLCIYTYTNNAMCYV